MVLLSFINPLSQEGELIVREKGSLEGIFDKDYDLVDIINRTEHQNIHDDSKIPKNVAELSIKRLQWYVQKKNSKEFKHNNYHYLFNENISEKDVIAFYISAQAVGIKYNSSSREAKALVEAQGKLIEERFSRMKESKKTELTEKILNQLIENDNISWIELEKMISSKKISMTDLLIDNGEIILDLDDFLNRFSEEFHDRTPERMYELLVGNKVKELIISRIIMQKTEDYIEKVNEMSSRIEAHPSLVKLSLQISEMLIEEADKSSSIYGGGFNENMKAGKLIKEYFPPCVLNTLEGVGSGNRNDAIVLFLTSFISYARLYPSVFRKDLTVKVSDIDKNLNITKDEILPIIYEAGDNCRPPLFEDQPEEKVNIISKLGFGMHHEVDIKNEGETKWYTPMSCDKVKIHLPILCKPDKTCKSIGNPLTYYSLKKLQNKNNQNKNKPDETEQKQ